MLIKMRLAGLLIVFLSFLSGCDSVTFDHRFGEPVDDETLAGFNGIWELGDNGNVIIASRGAGWLELVGLTDLSEVQADGKEPADAVDADRLPKPKIKVEETIFVQIRRFEGQYYAWLADAEDKPRPVYVPAKIASGNGEGLAEDGVLLIWFAKPSYFASAVDAEELAGDLVKDEYTTTTRVSSKPDALKTHLKEVPLHEWIDLEQPVVIKRLTRINQAE